MTDFEDSMEKIFDVPATSEALNVVMLDSTNAVVTPPTLSVVQASPKKPLATTLDQDLNDAYDQSKNNLEEIIDQGKEAMEKLMEIAKASESARAFEVFGQILKNVTDANKELLAMQKAMREMDGRKETGDTTNNIDKAVFVGSTAELQAWFKNKNK